MILSTPELIYPINAGTVFQLTELRERYNKNLKLICSHTVYIWIQREMATRGEKNSKYHKMRVCELCVPTVQGKEKHYLGWEGNLKLGTLRKYLKEGFEIIDENVTFNYTQESYARFYNRINLLH